MNYIQRQFNLQTTEQLKDNTASWITLIMKWLKSDARPLPPYCFIGIFNDITQDMQAGSDSSHKRSLIPTAYHLNSQKAMFISESGSRWQLEKHRVTMSFP